MTEVGTARWAPAVHVRSDLELERRLIDRLSREPRLRSVWVTDLVDPRTAYFRHTAPVPPSSEQARRMSAGREAHESVEMALATAAHVEVRAYREGVVGQIDIFDDRPTELKTTATPLGAEPLRVGRPAYLEQLGLYCGLVRRSQGRLLVASSAGTGELRAFDADFSDLEAVWAEAQRGAERLRRAYDRRTPAELPACAWRGRGCPFEEGRVCDCTGDEPPMEYRVASLATSFVEREDEADRLRERWTHAPEPPPAVRAFRDLLYPRRTYFERVAPGEGGTSGNGPPADPDGLYRRLSELLESGPAGDVTRVHPGGDRAPQAVACFRGAPFLLKVTRAWRAAPPAELLVGQPHYFLDLGLRCAALGTPEGWLLLGYERAETDRDRVRVYRVRFEPLSALRGEAEDRRAGLERALETHEPTAAAPCPVWMYLTCPYRDRCRCGGASPTLPDATGG